VTHLPGDERSITEAFSYESGLAPTEKIALAEYSPEPLRVDACRAIPFAPTSLCATTPVNVTRERA
jgi:hypothetical protein